MSLPPPFDRDRLLAWMAEAGLAPRTHDHPAVFRVDQGHAIKAALPGAHTKNLFLKGRGGQLCLVSARQDTTIDLKRLAKLLGSDRLSFASEEAMVETLGVTPGSVTALGLVNDVAGRVSFVLDRALWTADVVNFHPLTNMATTALDQTDFRRFLDLLERTPLIVDFSGEDGPRIVDPVADPVPHDHVADKALPPAEEA
ncbi:MAG: prolyl-tRNA synthetase associated domain-containing protein [Brevundimonas sp.]|uniref:prolyl-tRNA synthetase associated domain-containing protein n=1 Tax=Brevundimonas sp. TaxID=1871086 RepID=UPI0027372E7A|nr:prolyl-tRNA synthetase associated domain-containing protein [Brevundimonas sp.]MDP3378379.1 prolyl-tRNA synthetase associated domain-containing protein [Brevundimonas sp.]